ncbi:MAG: Cyclase family protein, partial [Acidobacteria bacterium]|nr:Cyclase family protein [Acidobacteriota bacterium]
MATRTPDSPLPRFRAIDLTHPLDAAGCAWPGEPPFRLEPPEVSSLPDGTRVVSHRFSCPEHAGTHIDAPSHVVARAEVGEDGDLVLLRLVASLFLWNMVRRLVGTVVEVGSGDLPPDLFGH